MKKLTNKDGYIIFWVLGVIFFASSMLYLGLNTLAATMKGTECIEKCNIKDSTEKIIQECLWEHYINDLNEGIRLGTHTDRMQNRVQWALPKGIKLADSEFENVQISPFAQTNAVSKQRNADSPLDEKLGHYIRQEFSVKTAQEKHNNPTIYTFEATLKEIPSTQFGFISNVVFSPKNTTIPLVVDGDAIMPGYRDLEQGVYLEFDTLFTKFFRKDFSSIGMTHLKSKLWESHKFSFSYGLPIHAYFLPSGIGSHYISQAYAKKPGAVFVTFDGESLDKMIPGISVQEFNKGPKRVVIDQNALNAQLNTIYIYCTTEFGADKGIVVKGNTHASMNSTKAILTNGRVWLWGNNTGTPTIVATTSGGWTLTDSSWQENTGSVNDLNLTWNGYLASPFGSTVLSSPQSAKQKGLLKINGTLLVGGKISGNLGKIEISHSEEIASQMSPFAERMMAVVDVKTKDIKLL